MFDELIKELAARNVRVELIGKHGRKGVVSYEATAVLYRGYDTDKSWPTFEFAVKGDTLDEIAGRIRARIPMVEPLIKLFELHRAHGHAFRETQALGMQMAEAVHGSQVKVPLEPNTDPKTAREFPLAGGSAA